MQKKYPSWLYENEVCASNLDVAKRVYNTTVEFLMGFSKSASNEYCRITKEYPLIAMEISSIVITKGTDGLHEVREYCV